MILKELDPFHYGGQHELAARVSADRVAYCLRRYFRRSTQIDVLNELRVLAGPALAHVDHLLLHPYGLIVLQRDDVVGRVRIHDDGDWLHWVDGAPVPIGSPITDAYVQALLFKSYLDKRVRQKGFFDRLELDVLVVVSDECEIEWPLTGRLAEVCNRDEIYDRVIWAVERCRGARPGPGLLSEPEREVLGAFLRRSHIQDRDATGGQGRAPGGQTGLRGTGASHD